jgi:hypothetical protein
MYYYLYKITNKLNGKVYIGVHRTKDLKDRYMGSGVLLKKSIKKYGKENFIKEILEYFDNDKDMLLREKEVVNEDFLSTKNSYNITIGGGGGFYAFNKKGKFTFNDKDDFARKCGLKSVTKRNEIYKNNPERKKEIYNNISSSLKNKFKNDPKFAKKLNDHLKEMGLKSLNSEAKKKKEETFKKIKHAQGEKNSQYNTFWAYNLETKENRKFKKDSILPEGWVKGRLINKIYSYWGYNPILKISKMFKKDDVLPEGWVKGRI